MIPLHDDNPTTIRPFVTIIIIIACVLIFAYQFSQGPQAGKIIVYALGVIPAVLLNDVLLPAELNWVPAYVTIFSSMFLHGSWLHLLSNMLYLWVFGNNIEDAMGHVKFILFYLICGVAAVYAQALPDPASQIPMVGASGAISGILGAYLLLYPKATITSIIPLGFIIQTVRLKAIWVLAFWFILQIFSSITNTQEGGGVAFGAHIGGFIAGMLLIGFFKNKNHPIHNPLDALKR